MSLNIHTIAPVPEETARVARAAFPRGTLALDLRDQVGVLYEDAQFAALFPATGQPAEAPWRLALVSVLQFVEGLPDRQAADAVRSRIDWKYLLGLELSDAGFDHTVLHGFRARLLAGGAEQQLLETVLAHLKERGLVKARGRQRTDSTHVVAAVRAMNRLECVGETLRAALNVLAAVAPQWLVAQITPEWFERYSERCEDYRLPKTQSERDALVEMIGRDGFHLLNALYDPATPVWLQEIPAVQSLRQVWVQQYYGPELPVRWRADTDVPPAAVMLHSPYDVDARYSTKRSVSWTGYKVHLTETCDRDLPHVITEVQTTLATTTDYPATESVHAALAAKDLLPAEHLVDGGYVDAENLVTSRDTYGVDLVGPARPDTSWQAQAAQGYALPQFAIDWDAQRVTCPQGKTNRTWAPSLSPQGTPVTVVRFHTAECRACPVRALCTQAKTGARELTLRPHEQHEALFAARLRQTTRPFKRLYGLRAGVAALISQSARAFELRQTRYRGLAKTHLQHILIAVALTVVRLVVWLRGTPCAPTRRSWFAALAPRVQHPASTT